MGEAKRRTMPSLAPWTPFERGELDPADFTPEALDLRAAEQAAALNMPVDVIRAQLVELLKDEIWVNSRYQVNVRRGDAPESGSRIVWLSIKRRDKQPPGPERFRDFQRIKNELVGPEHEAVEIYPAESRMVDTSNQYHLWVFSDPAFRLPFGFMPSERVIVKHSASGTVQQPFDDGEEP